MQIIEANQSLSVYLPEEVAASATIRYTKTPSTTEDILNAIADDKALVIFMTIFALARQDSNIL